MSGGGGALTVERAKRGKSSKRKKMKRVGFTLDMTPLVDITFLLLTFFMFTTTMAAPQIMEMTIPPEVIKEVEVKASELLTILVDKDSKIYWYPGEEIAQPIQFKDIKSLAVRENLKPEVKNKLITALKVHDDAPYGLIVNILDELNQAEILITSEIAKDMGPDGKPLKRERRFTITPLTDREFKKIDEVPK